MRKIGINLQAKNGLAYDEYIRQMRDVGFTATFAGCGEPALLPSVGESCAKYGVACESLHGPFGHINDIWLPGVDGDAMLGELKQGVDLCGVVGAGILVVHLSSGNRAPSITDVGRGRFTDLVEYAASRKILLAFENQRKLANIAWAMETFDETVAGLCWDCGHENCFTPGRQYMPIFGNRILCTHIHDNLGNYNEDLHLLPFDGTLDFDRVADSIRGSGFSGTLMLEGHAAASNRYDDISVAEYLALAAAGVHRLRQLVDGKKEEMVCGI